MYLCFRKWFFYCFDNYIDVIITNEHAADAPQFEKLIENVSKNFEIKEISADAAYSSKRNIETVLKHGGKPYIMFKSNARIKVANQNISKVLTNKEYTAIWKNFLFGERNLDFKIEEIFIETEIYKGYDTSAKIENLRKSSVLQVMMGSVVLISIKELNEDVLVALENIQKNGVGNDTIDGFGEVEICGKK